MKFQRLTNQKTEAEETTEDVAVRDVTIKSEKLKMKEVTSNATSKES